MQEAEEKEVAQNSEVGIQKAKNTNGKEKLKTRSHKEEFRS